MAIQHAVDLNPPPLDVASARAAVDRCLAGLPDTLLAARPDEIRRLARRALDAEQAARRRRVKVGDEPSIDGEAAEAAASAHASLREARDGVVVASSEANRLLTIGNAWGVACIAGAFVLLKNGAQPMATPVFSAVVGGAAGPITTFALGLSRRSAASMRLIAARSSWAAALEAAGTSTMGELAARRIAYDAWRRRQAEADAATAVAREARAAWHRVAGPKRHPREAPALVARLADARAAQLQLFEALVVQRMRPRAAPPVVERSAALPMVWTAPPTLAELAGLTVVDEPVARAEPPAATAPADDEHWLGDAFSRLRGRGLRLWSRG